MDWIVLGGSLAAICAVAALVHFLRLGGASIADEREAMQLAEDNLSGFTPSSAIISSDGQSAIVTGSDNQAALVKRHGAWFAMRCVDLPLNATQNGDTLIVQSGESRFGHVVLQLRKEDADKLLTLM